MRIKRGTVKNRKHKKMLKQAKGYRMSYSKLYRRAKEAVWHAGSYSYGHRRHRRAQKRREWIETISAKLAGSGVSYSKFVGGLKKNNIEIDRKNLAIMAIDKPAHFDALVETVK
ncbi:50S ribosomal protein L20 [Candidatus Dojkabacteria bacterium]|uniref:Large ribosomal subunit protein bL20 n=1 Tax=Candidatus Dojkabacteria bacterium TaxID=2099670 RepID=A0A955L1J6_9BACT|nr:50S ribosomal protein L20 [Candidatus Dojkabacteria bacterium]